MRYVGGTGVLGTGRRRVAGLGGSRDPDAAHAPSAGCGLAFATGGWTLSLMLATGGVFVGISGKMSGAGGPPPQWMRPATLILAALLILVGVVTWMRQGGRRERAPAWLRALALSLRGGGRWQPHRFSCR